MRQTISIALLYLLFMASFLNSATANDSAAEISASGILFKEEKNISIENEDLFISLKKVEVSYVFKNHSDKDISIEVAFPVPEYTAEDAQRGLPFDDFVVEVNGNKIKNSSEVRALVNGKDQSAVLKQMGISIYDFGGYSHPFYKEFYFNLADKGQKALKKAGLVNEDGYPLWTVSKRYHWTQTFPANKTTAIRLSFFSCIPQFLFQGHSPGVAPCSDFLAHRVKQNQPYAFLLFWGSFFLR